MPEDPKGAVEGFGKILAITVTVALILAGKVANAAWRKCVLGEKLGGESDDPG